MPTDPEIELVRIGRVGRPHGTDGAFVAIANSTVADGVVDANRDAGAAAITMANGVTINTGSGNITLAMSTGPTTNNTSGDITISNLTTTGSVLISQGGQTAGSSILRTATSLVSAATVALDIGNAANTTGVIGTTGSRIATTAANAQPHVYRLLDRSSLIILILHV